ncbi:Di-copper centre-containing protein [Basidiobolus meristosporus CBS 931.73]|uniref:Di-copper centre-containing protein n=1 Tax=Basidiobolus meristosporus CBS 931.73 TaxID=1314790 RepID=A0A1Y1Y511_9FUNG|nr:Di-copper centre-containing protein [Basidiobolus meristosporus CBS 931.73]|eukprot:ORX93111.1 Di-copper centre-containing protein [Basidiobolus meristosporus CBS 931.73]
MLVFRSNWLLSLITAISYATAVVSQCSNIAVRKEIRELSVQERLDFINAVLAINIANQTQERDQLSTYATLSQIHVDYFSEAHGTAAFFPWHRKYLRDFEMELQKVNPNVVIPYWDWSLDSQNPAGSEVFTASFFGGNGGGNNSCVSTGPFRNWEVQIPFRHCLQRRFNRGGGRISPFYSPEALAAIVRNSKNYADLADQIESPPHGTVHVGVGGDMSRAHSSNDPLFWLHHAFVDKIWADWQAMNPSKAYSYGGINVHGEEAQLDDVMNPFNTQVYTAMSTTSNGFCYRYSNSHRTRQKRQTEPIESTPDYDLVIPDPLPEEHIMMNHGDAAAVRAKEARLAEVVAFYNLLPNYVSPVAPARRQETMRKLIRGELGNLLRKIPAMDIRKISK